MTLALGTRGVALIQRSEQLRLKAFKPTPADVWTIGWGHTKGVKDGDTCTLEQANAWFLEDVAISEQAINRLGYKLTQAMFDALVSLAYNCGVGSVAVESLPGDASWNEILAIDAWNWLFDLNLSPSAQESTVGNALAAARYYTAWRGFALWTKQAGKDLLGLARRRSEEMALFLEDGLPEE